MRSERGLVIEICGLPASGKSAIHRRFSGLPETLVHASVGPADLPALIVAAPALWWLGEYVLETSRSPLSQAGRVLKVMRASARNRTAAREQSGVILVDEGVVHYLCSMSIPAKRNDFPRLPELTRRLIERSLDGVAWVKLPTTEAMSRALKRDSPCSRFNAQSDPAALESLYSDFATIIERIRSELLVLGVPTIELDGSADPDVNVDRLRAWADQLLQRRQAREDAGGSEASLGTAV